jgi:ammonia channel protein AmtB
MNWTVVGLIILGLVVLRYFVLAYYPDLVNGYISVFIIVVFMAWVIARNWRFAIGLGLMAIISRYIYIRIVYNRNAMIGVDPKEFNNVANTLAFVIMLLVVVCISWIFTGSSLHLPQRI